eukprot:402480-Rhodomonas_salina.1
MRFFSAAESNAVLNTDGERMMLCAYAIAVLSLGIRYGRQGTRGRRRRRHGVGGTALASYAASGTDVGSMSGTEMAVWY